MRLCPSLTNNILLVLLYSSCIITPNIVEYNLLLNSAIEYLKGELEDLDENARGKDIKNKLEHLNEDLTSHNEHSRIRALSQFLSGDNGCVAILLKGATDMITAGDDVFLVEEMGSPRRCGGQVSKIPNRYTFSIYFIIYVFYATNI